MSKGVVILAAGGTGGHLFPAEALAHELQHRGWDVHLATDARAQRFVSSFPDDHVHIIRSATVTGRNPLALTKTFLKLWQGNLDSRRLYRRLKPALVVGFGGYPTLPPLYAATRMRIATLIHEQNAVMGRANKGLAARVDAIAGGFLSSDSGQYAAKIIKTGNPVRPPVLEQAAQAYQASAGNDRFRLLVFGGSQGAQYFSSALPQAIAMLPANLRDRLLITQQARPEDELRLREAYEELGIQAQVASFFGNMPELMADAQFVISRSGASTVSEIAVIGRPSILVPFPFALDHDQAANAQALADAGGAQVIRQSDLSAERLAQILTEAMTQPARLKQIAAAAKGSAMPDATRLLADVAEAIAGGKSAAEYKKQHLKGIAA